MAEQPNFSNWSPHVKEQILAHIILKMAPFLTLNILYILCCTLNKDDIYKICKPLHSVFICNPSWFIKTIHIMM